jgi:hypothetical protein
MTAIYTLIGEHASLTWLSHARSLRTAEGSQTLAHAIQAHITLPLRDLTPSSARLFDQLRYSGIHGRSTALAAKEEDSSQANPTRLVVRATVIFLLSVLIVVVGILTTFSLWEFL